MRATDADERTAATVPAIDEARLVAYVEASDPNLARHAAEVAVASVEATAARVRPNPTVAFEREEVFPDRGIATTYLRVALPLDLSGRRGARADAAMRQARAIDVGHGAERLALVVGALRAFTEAAYARLHAELLEADRAALADAVEIVRKRTTAGAVSGYDLQRVELELAAYDERIADARGALAAARLALGALVGLPDGADAATSLATPEPPPLAEALVGAVERRAEYRAAALRAESAEALAAAARRAWIPELSVSAGLVTADDASDATAPGYSVGVAIDVPLFDRGEVDRARASALARAAAAAKQVIARDAPAAVRVRHVELAHRVARARAFAVDRLVRLPPLIRAAQTAYREGAGTVIELLDAHAVARDTRLRELVLRRDARLAELELWLAIGRRP